MSKTIQQPDQLIRMPNVKHRVGLGRTSIYALVAEGKFPAPVKIGKRAVAWSARAVDQWIADQLKQAGQ